MSASVRIAPSVLSADFSRLGDEVESVVKAGPTGSISAGGRRGAGQGRPSTSLRLRATRIRGLEQDGAAIARPVAT